MPYSETHFSSLVGLSIARPSVAVITDNI